MPGSICVSCWQGLVQTCVSLHPGVYQRAHSSQQPLAAERPNKSVPCLPRSFLEGCYLCREEQGCGRALGSHTHCLYPPGRLPRGCGGGGDTWPGLGRDHKTLLLHNSHGSLWEGVFHGKMGWSIAGVGSPWASITLQPLLPQGAAKCRLIPLGVQGVTTLFTELAGGFSAFSLNI